MDEFTPLFPEPCAQPPKRSFRLNLKLLNPTLKFLPDGLARLCPTERKATAALPCPE